MWERRVLSRSHDPNVFLPGIVRTPFRRILVHVGGIFEELVLAMFVPFYRSLFQPIVGRLLFSQFWHGTRFLYPLLEVLPSLRNLKGLLLLLVFLLPSRCQDFPPQRMGSLG